MSAAMLAMDPTRSDHAQFVRLIDRGFVSGLSARGWTRVIAHVARCPSCRAYYDRLALIRDALLRRL